MKADAHSFSGATQGVDSFLVRQALDAEQDKDIGLPSVHPARQVVSLYYNSVTCKDPLWITVTAEVLRRLCCRSSMFGQFECLPYRSAIKIGVPIRLAIKTVSVFPDGQKTS